MKIYAFIPARGGSKGVPGKNIKLFAGLPLIVHTINHVKSSSLIDHVFVSTDNNQIATVGKSAGAEIINRPQEISGDTSTTESAVEHFIDYLKSSDFDQPDIIVLLQATSPLRPDNCVQDALEYFIINSFDSMVSISPTHRFFWRVEGKIAQPLYDYMNRPRRQDLQSEDITYVENGSFYIFSEQHFNNTKNRLGGKIGYHIIPEEYSYEIDSFADFTYLEKLSEQLQKD